MLDNVIKTNEAPGAEAGQTADKAPVSVQLLEADNGHNNSRTKVCPSEHGDSFI